MKNHILPLFLAALLCAASCKPEADLHPTSVSVSPSSVSMVEGETTILSVSVQPAEAQYSGIKWTSSDTKVATVNDGLVTAVSAGKATISASADGINGIATVTVNAKVYPVQSVSLDKTELELTEGDEAQLTATVAPDNATDKSVSWKSSDEKVATVSSDGKVTAVAPGETTITVTTNDGGKTAICTVTVLPEGALSGVFSVSDTKQVRFSKGNLQATYDGSKYSWGFAAKQYDYIGNAPGNTTIDSQKKGEVVDLFGWSTDANYFGISTSKDYNDFSGDLKDWGKNIGDGSTWRILSGDEWRYMFNTRTVNRGTGEGKSYQHATINSDATGVYGMILYPDNYTETAKTSYTSTEWATAERKGCVFLPAAGYHYGSDFYDVGSCGQYNTLSRSNGAAYVLITDNRDPDIWLGSACYGNSVRLVADVK